MGEIKNAYTIFLGKPEGNVAFRRSRHRWKNNIKTALK
jgi:hypothetical protein